ncbi:hypothetical protein SNEBB_002585 [Seison nebaliae]|nr:hypothetical protein SNEBB_002585 [Seison nebaliae]
MSRRTKSTAKVSKKVVKPVERVDSIQFEKASIISEVESFFVKDNEFSDLIILVGNKKLNANTGVISAASPVLRKEFLEKRETHNMEESKKKMECLSLCNNEYDDVLTLLQFIYPQFSPRINDNNVTAMLRMSEDYDISSIKRLALNHIYNKLDKIKAMRLPDATAKSPGLDGFFIRFTDDESIPIMKFCDQLLSWLSIAVATMNTQLRDRLLNVLSFFPLFVFEKSTPYQAMSDEEKAFIMTAKCRLLENSREAQPQVRKENLRSIHLEPFRPTHLHEYNFINQFFLSQFDLAMNFFGIFGSAKEDEDEKDKRERKKIHDEIERLVDRLTMAVRTEDKRISLNELKELMPVYYLDIGTLAMTPMLNEMRSEYKDTRTCIEILHIMQFLLTVDCEEDGEHISIQLAEIFSIKDENISLLIELLSEIDWHVRFETIKLFRILMRSQLVTIQQKVARTPNGMSKLVELLSDLCDVVKNETVELLIVLIDGNPTLQLMFAFENGHQTLFKIIESEGDVISGDVLVFDCLTLMGTVLKGNSKVQEIFYENKGVKKLSELYPLSAMSDISYWTNEQLKNYLSLLHLINCLVHPSNAIAIITKIQKETKTCGLFHKMCATCTIDSILPAILTHLLLTIADCMRGNEDNQLFFSQITMQSRDRTELSLFRILLKTLTKKWTHNAYELPFRLSILYTIQSFYYLNKNGQNNIISSLVNDENGFLKDLLYSLYHLPTLKNDSLTVTIISILFIHLLTKNSKNQILVANLKYSQLLPKSLPPNKVSDIVVDDSVIDVDSTFIQHLLNLLHGQQDIPIKCQIAILQLIVVMSYECKENIRVILNDSSAISYLLSIMNAGGNVASGTVSSTNLTVSLVEDEKIGRKIKMNVDQELSRMTKNYEESSIKLTNSSILCGLCTFVVGILLISDDEKNNELKHLIKRIPSDRIETFLDYVTITKSYRHVIHSINYLSHLIQQCHLPLTQLTSMNLEDESMVETDEANGNKRLTIHHMKYEQFFHSVPSMKLFIAQNLMFDFEFAKIVKSNEIRILVDGYDTGNEKKNEEEKKPKENIQKSIELSLSAKLEQRDKEYAQLYHYYQLMHQSIEERNKTIDLYKKKFDQQQIDHENELKSHMAYLSQQSNCNQLFSTVKSRMEDDVEKLVKITNSLKDVRFGKDEMKYEGDFVRINKREYEQLIECRDLQEQYMDYMVKLQSRNKNLKEIMRIQCRVEPPKDSDDEQEENEEEDERILNEKVKSSSETSSSSRSDSMNNNFIMIPPTTTNSNILSTVSPLKKYEPPPPLTYPQSRGIPFENLINSNNSLESIPISMATTTIIGSTFTQNSSTSILSGSTPTPLLSASNMFSAITNNLFSSSPDKYETQRRLEVEASGIQTKKMNEDIDFSQFLPGPEKQDEPESFFDPTSIN